MRGILKVHTKISPGRDSAMSSKHSRAEMVMCTHAKKVELLALSMSAERWWNWWLATREGVAWQANDTSTQPYFVLHLRLCVL
jgi:hypothetical protein